VFCAEVFSVDRDDPGGEGHGRAECDRSGAWISGALRSRRRRVRCPAGRDDPHSARGGRGRRRGNARASGGRGLGCGRRIGCGPGLVLGVALEGNGGRRRGVRLDRPPGQLCSPGPAQRVAARHALCDLRQVHSGYGSSARRGLRAHPDRVEAISRARRARARALGHLLHRPRLDSIGCGASGARMDERQPLPRPRRSRALHRRGAFPAHPEVPRPPVDARGRAGRW